MKWILVILLGICIVLSGCIELPDFPPTTTTLPYATTIPTVTTTPVVTTTPIITTTPVVTTIPTATIERVWVRGRCYPKPKTYGCCECVVWENGYDNQDFASATRYDDLIFDVEIMGSGTVYVEFWFCGSTTLCDCKKFPWYCGTNVKVTKELTLAQNTLNVVRFNTGQDFGFAPMVSVVTGLHDAFFYVYDSEGNLLHETGRIAWPVDVF